MRIWVRATKATRCGRCPVVIPLGAPMQRVPLPQVKTPLVRCAACAEGEAPPDLPERMERREPEAPVTLTRFSRAALPKDFKMRQSGEREPGEEG